MLDHGPTRQRHQFLWFTGECDEPIPTAGALQEEFVGLLHGSTRQTRRSYALI